MKNSNHHSSRHLLICNKRPRHPKFLCTAAAFWALVVSLALTPAYSQTVVQAADTTALQSAIATVPDGGMIELTGTNYPSPSGGFVISDPSRTFTIRPAVGVNPVLDGGGTRIVLRLQDAGPITFEGLTFRNGLSTTFNDQSGGVTLKNSIATFVGCTFEDNVTNPSVSGGGGVQMNAASTGYFVDCLWSGNTSKNYGGGMAVFESAAWVHNSQVLTNRVNLPGHISTATGGGFTLSASDQVGGTVASLRVTNTRFQDNQAGFAGGAIFGIGVWVDPLATPRVDLLAANCTFDNNIAAPDGGTSTPSPPEGGAIHSENQMTTRVYNSRFLKNRADIGGAMSLYRAIVEVSDSVFRGNRATGVAQGGFGGAISAASNDTAADGTENRRTASLTVADTLIQGAYDTVTTVGQIGGGVLVNGDLNRNYGLNGVSTLGTTAQNRATATFTRVAVHDCDIEQLRSSAGFGAGVEIDLSDFTLQDSLITASDSPALQGGGLRVATESATTVTGTTMAKNTSPASGGAVYLSGSAFTLSNSNLIENEAPSGSAIRSDPKANVAGSGVDVDVTGTVSNSTISNNTTGVPFVELDSNTGPINDLRYDGNTIYHQSASIYSNPLGGAQNAAGLNSLTVNRSSAPNTDKSQVNNVAAGSAPVVGHILAVPPQILPVTASGDAASTTDSFVVYAWSGGAATLDGGSVSGNTGLTNVGVGTHTLSVAGNDFAANVTSGVAANASWTASPPSINPGGTSTLSWATTAGTFLDMSIDQGAAPMTATASGSVDVSPTATTTYRLFLVTEEGGTVKEVTVTVVDTFIFTDGFESGNLTAWSGSVP